MFKDNIQAQVVGMLKISDVETGKVLVNKKNAREYIKLVSIRPIEFFIYYIMLIEQFKCFVRSICF